MKIRFQSVWALAALAGVVTSGCTSHEPVYVAPPPVAGTYVPAPAPGPATVQEPPPGTAAVTAQPPPAPPAEVAPPAPGPEYVWTTGYYNWNGAAWIWVPGLWVVPPYRGALWFGGHWVYRGGRHLWVRGRWR